MAIDFNLLQPVDIGGEFLAGLQAAQQQRLQQQQQAQALARAQRMQQDIAAWKGDMSPERTAALFLNYPEIKEQIAASKAVLDDAAKRDRLGFNTRVVLLSRAGQKDRVREMATQRIAAYRNAGKTKEAAEAEDMLKSWEIDPSVIEGALALDIYDDDPKIHENLFGKSEMTSFQKDLVAANIDPKSPEGVAMAAKFAQLKIDPLVEQETPGGGKFVGQQSEYYRRYGGGAPAPSKMQTISTAAQYEALPPGVEFIDVRDGKHKRKPASADPRAGVPAPSLDASGKPKTLTRAQYQAVVQSKGKAKTDAWLQANNITVSDR